MHTPLVLWGWTPGDGRTPVPAPQHEFLEKIQEWAEKGAACPADASATTSQTFGSLVIPITSYKPTSGPRSETRMISGNSGFLKYAKN